MLLYVTGSKDDSKDDVNYRRSFSQFVLRSAGVSIFCGGLKVLRFLNILFYIYYIIEKLVSNELLNNLYVFIFTCNICIIYIIIYISYNLYIMYYIIYIINSFSIVESLFYLFSNFVKLCF